VKANQVAAQEAALVRREKVLAVREAQLKVAEGGLEEQRHLAAEVQRQAENQLLREENMLREDAKLMQERNEQRLADQMEQLRDEFELKRVRLLRKLQSAQNEIQRLKSSEKALTKKRDLLIHKNSDLERRLKALRATHDVSLGHVSRLEAELDNAHKKARVLAWKFEKEIAKQLQEQDERHTERLANSQMSNHSSHAVEDHMANKSNGVYFLLLIDGLIELAVGTSRRPVKGSKKAISYDLFAHSLLPGICHALDLNSVQGTPETARQLLILVLHCAGCSFDYSTPKETSSQAQGLVDRFASRLLAKLEGSRNAPSAGPARATGPPHAKPLHVQHPTENGANEKVSLAQDRSAFLAANDIELRALSAMAALCVHMLKKPLDPATMAKPLRVLVEASGEGQVQDLLFRFHGALEAVVFVLRYSGLHAWRVCIDETILILLTLSRKGPKAHDMVGAVTRTENFREASIAVLDSLLELEPQATAGVETICEAASVVAVYLQRLSQTASGRRSLRRLFRQVDFVGTLQECVRAASTLDLTVAQASESLQFFSLNAVAIIEALSGEQEDHEDDVSEEGREALSIIDDNDSS